MLSLNCLCIDIGNYLYVIEAGMVVQWLALSEEALWVDKREPFCVEFCMSYLCMCGFSPGNLVSFHSSNTCELD